MKTITLSTRQRIHIATILGMQQGTLGEQRRYMLMLDKIGLTEPERNAIDYTENAGVAAH